ncbi:hypothetical protein CK203_114054 [Vitis vinifera]|uniref:Transposase MuDR plant domain-containing protein n=1 Tax=Vitis vinifera TaxID=29760 RepID=A0A438CPA8_VITVI|nr:hypothetical protein CK203_114054 [Vitis vinifera]
MLSMIFRYPILMSIGNGNINYIQLPIKDDDDVRLMFHVVAQIPPSNTIEMYLQTCPRDHSSELSPSFDQEIMGHDVEIPAKGNSAMQIDEMDENLAHNDEMGGNLAVDEINEMHYDDEPPTNKVSSDDGLRFESKEDLQYAVKRYAICRNQHLVVCESEPQLWAVRCKKWQEGCNWRLRACRRKSHGMFEITKYAGPHTCVYPKLSQDHSQLDSTLIAREIQNVVQRDHTTSIATLHQIVKDKFGYDVHYRRIWEAKRKTMLRVFGDWDESYQALSKWMNILQLTNPGTKIVWKTIPLGGISGNVRFMRVFWAFEASVEGFKHCRPIIQIDGIFLYGKYMGKLLIATSIDGNGHVFPLAFAIVEEESHDSCLGFLLH